MTKTQIIITLFSMAALLLAACEPVLTPTQPSPADKPAGEIGGVQEVSGSVDYNPNPQAAFPELMKLAAANNSFALDLYKQLAGQEGNLFYSPYSIFQALLMTYAGALGNTASQMEGTLHLPYSQEQVHAVMNALNKQLEESTQSDGKPVFEFNIANALWGQQGYAFQEEFLNVLAANYAAGMQTVDFKDAEAARSLINLWVAAQTNDKIKDLIPKGVLNDLTRLVLTNAVYFKAAWLNQFDAANTTDGVFYLPDGKEKNVPMMRQTTDMNALANETVQAVELSYEGGRYSMVIMMPAKGTLAEFEAGLDQAALEGIFADLGSALVEFAMPKFKLEASFSLAEQMQALGMVDAFDVALADFTGISGEPDLYIKSVLHKAFVDVNEEGTEAAAATAVVLSQKGMPGERLTITIDNPFLFAIRENGTNTVLFMGRVVEP